MWGMTQGERDRHPPRTRTRNPSSPAMIATAIAAQECGLSGHEALQLIFSHSPVDIGRALSRYAV